MSETLQQKVSLAQRRQDFDAAHLWLDSPLPGTDEDLGHDGAAAAERAALDVADTALPAAAAVDRALALQAADDRATTPEGADEG